MDYFDNQQLLKRVFNLENPLISIPGTDTRILNCRFLSEPLVEAVGENDPASGILVQHFKGNQEFTYPVFMPGGKSVAEGAVILLHGLNERNWSKYLYWAQYLAEKTMKAVILFPIAWHVNRSPVNWSDPRLMEPVATERSARGGSETCATPFNAALSSRLELYPELFCKSGLQTCNDLVALATTIRKGDHPLLVANSQIDFFAYSVGAFLLEILLIANPAELFSTTRSFLFLGGSSFEQMRGISRYIMDSPAFDKLEKTYLAEDPARVRNKIINAHSRYFNLLWASFMSMLRLDSHRASREDSFRRMEKRISAIGLARDEVIPGGAILNTLRGIRSKSGIPVEIMDFPYPYWHENPFPLNRAELRPAVDQSFRQVFDSAASFLH